MNAILSGVAFWFPHIGSISGMSIVTARLKEKIVREGLASVRETEQGAKLVGGLFGFLVAETLNTPEEFEAVLQHRESQRVSLMMDEKSDHGLFWYWVHQSATAQIQFVYDRLNVFWYYELPPERRGSLSAQAALHIHSLLER